MKECTTCRIKKADCDFQIRRASPDGLTASCKECLHDRDQRRYKKEKKLRADRHKAYVATPDGRRASNKAKMKWIRNNQTARAAQVILNNALRDGKIVRPKWCKRCKRRVAKHAHHEDYSRPLDILWLCPICHKKVHAK